MIDFWKVVKNGKIITVWCYKSQATSSARRNGGAVIHTRHKVGQI